MGNECFIYHGVSFTKSNSEVVQHILLSIVYNLTCSVVSIHLALSNDTSPLYNGVWNLMSAYWLMIKVKLTNLHHSTSQIMQIGWY